MKKLREVLRVLFCRMHKKTLFAAGIFLLLGVVLGFWKCVNREPDSREVVRAESGGEGQIFQYAAGGEPEGEIAVDILPRERTLEEIHALLTQAVSEWEAQYLGENDSAEEILYPLELAADFCEGRVTAAYESSCEQALDIDGKIYDKEIPARGLSVELQAEFSCDGETRVERRRLNLVLPKRGTAEWLRRRIQEAVSQKEQNSRTEDAFFLPSAVEGYPILWKKQSDSRWLYLVFIGAAAAFCLEWKQREDERRKEKVRRDSLTFEYPQMVEQISLLLESGMTILGAWEKVLASDKRMEKNSRISQRFYIDEMWITYREIKKGCGEREAYERFGTRIGLTPYRRFSSILTQNLSKGTKNVRELLCREAEEALELRRNRARRLGEEAGTKLLFPMLFMFVLILLALFMPAIQNF